MHRLIWQCFAKRHLIVSILFAFSPLAGALGSTATVLYSFRGGIDGATPRAAFIVDAKTGILHGTTYEGGGFGCSVTGCGTVFQLTPPAPGQTAWTETVLHKFDEAAGAVSPCNQLTQDKTGALFGATCGEGAGHV